ncbi:MAG: hypothetical protein IJ728_06555 [Selenomonadaceae bacterium]|nr:hypothetical protein [Selenomonadaceae bacterium]
MFKFFRLLLILIFGFFSFAQAREIYISENEISDDENEQPISTQNNNSVEWWKNDQLIAKGYGFSTNNKALARRAAIMDAYRNLAMQVSEIHITAEKKVLQVEVHSVITNAEIIDERFDEDGNCIVEMTVPIYGVKNSIAKAVFKPVEKEDFPPPTNEDTENEVIEGNYTGLIIDCSDLELNPVMSPKIFNEDSQSIYSYNNLDYEKVIEKGMIGYSINNIVSDMKFENKFVSLKTLNLKNNFVRFEDRFLLLNNFINNYDYITRAGNNPLIIKANSMNDNGTCPVISKSDSDKILKENQISHFLNDGSVVFTGRVLGMKI